MRASTISGSGAIPLSMAPMEWQRYSTGSDLRENLSYNRSCGGSFSRARCDEEWAVAASFAGRYLFRLTTSCSNSSEVVMTREFAWNPRWVRIRFVNSWARSTFDISSVPGATWPRPPVLAEPT